MAISEEIKMIWKREHPISPFRQSFFPDEKREYQSLLFNIFRIIIFAFLPERQKISHQSLAQTWH